MSGLFTSGGQSIGASALATVLPMNIQDWLPLGLTGLTFSLSKGLSRFFSSTIVQKHQFYHTQPSLWVQLSHPYMTIGKTMCVSHSVMSNSATPCQALLSMGFSRQKYWKGLPLPSGGSSWPRDWTWVSCTAGRFFTVSASWRNHSFDYMNLCWQSDVSGFQ